jgi:DNA-binding CsgD family transcriptional regulator
MEANDIRNVPFLRINYLYKSTLQISEDRKKCIIDLYFNQHKTYAEIAQIEHISPRDIHAIIKEEEARRQRHKQQELSSKAYKLFSEGKTPLQVAIALNIRQSEAMKYYREYWKLRGLQMLDSLHIKTNGKIWLLWKLYKELIKKKRMSIEQVVNAVEIAVHKLPYMESLYEQTKDQAEKMQRTIQRLANDIRALEYKISILDKIAFSSEQECRRTQQQVQELIAQKDRIEKLIANILNGEVYSMIKQIVKENVKSILTDNKILITTAFAAIMLTLKTDPEMVKLIQNIPSANDGEQRNDINITKYLEFNKNNILGLAEKNYENLIKVLTNNAIDSA